MLIWGVYRDKTRFFNCFMYYTKVDIMSIWREMLLKVQVVRRQEINE